MGQEEILLNQILEEQADMTGVMTAVEAFAFKKDLCQLPQEASRYKQLIPKTAPGPGEQYAFEVNLDQCTGCKACVTACHNENGLDIDETWRSVGMLRGTTPQGPAIQHVTGACHHCLDPACMNGCPVKAYEKDPATGVVKHLDDQCIGCQYCILKCPYDVPKYSKKKGIVHKCDMCISRLKAGQAPACVRACPNEAIRITLVETATVRKAPSEFVKIPQAPHSSYTLPTTRYVTTKNLVPEMSSIDAGVFQPEHSHMPLVVMLVLTQLSVGTFLAGGVVHQFVQEALSSMLSAVYAWTVLGVGALALNSSLFHLGRPKYAFRAVLGLKTSWLSREILSFGTFAFLAFIFAVQTKYPFLPPAEGNALAYIVSACGLFAVFTSVMVYRDTRRELWDTPLTTFKFFMTALLLGTATVMAVSLSACAWESPSLTFMIQSVGGPLAAAMVLLSMVKMLVEASLFSQLRRPGMTSLKKSAVLMTVHLKVWTIQRFVYGAIGGILMPALFLTVSDHLTVPGILAWVWMMLVALTAAEMMERYLFFRAVIPLKMPQ
ncbi:MAG: dimethyl sulfoxide reductase anchor subunit [Candidatus Omnitrophica bacterium]|nr:dimethyl sulfoxide reductase anchor subunit [Candidatus Omnitrophota bacterium]